MKVKLLTWDEADNADIGFGLQYVTGEVTYGGCNSPVRYVAVLEAKYSDGFEIESMGYGQIYETLEEAKAACQEHFESLIMSGLETEDES